MNVVTNPQRCQKSSECPRKHSEHGLPKVKLKVSLPKVDTIVTNKSTSQPNITTRTRNPTSTQESPPRNNVLNWKDKLHSFRKVTQTTRLSKTLDQVSISRDLDYNVFWDSSLVDTYQRLWLPTKTDSVGLDLKSLNQFVNTKGSFFESLELLSSKSLQENLQTTSFQSLQFSQPDTTAPESTLHCRKIRILPSKQQVALFNRCIGASRFFYNRTIDYINKKRQTKEKYSLNIKAMRHDVMPCDKDLKEGDELYWQKEVPYDTRDLAMKDALTAIKGNLTKLRNKQIQHFEMKFRSKKHGCMSFKVNPKALTNESIIFERRLGKKKMRVRKKDLKDYLNNGNIADKEFTILKTKSNKWYICIPRLPKDPPVIHTPAYQSVFLDPGVRTFQTFYSPDGLGGKIGSVDFNDKLKHLASRHDYLISIACRKEQKVSSKTKRHLFQRCAKLRDKIKNKVNDLHWQTCNFLCNTFETIFLPEFEVQYMAQGSHLGSKITRKMLQLSHGMFRERLKYYAKKTGRHLYIVNEAFTTKTCGVCGRLQDMEGSKVYNCPHCHSSIDRDYNGARNICLKILGYAR